MKIIVDKKFNNKSIEYFLDYYKQSKKNKYLLFLEKRILLNEEICNKDDILYLNDVIDIKLKKESIDYILDDKECDVVYEDKYILIVNKPSGIIIYDEINSLANMVARYYKNNNLNISVRHLHRLDKETQGLVMYCKNSFFQPYLDNMFLNKKIERYYKAIVYGDVKKDNFIINFPIGRNRHVNNKYRVSKNGKGAITRCKVLKRKGKYTLLDCKLETGRTHQIRVHLSSKNLYIVNDNIYGKKSDDFKEMGLYAYKLVWNDIITDKKMVVELPPIEELNYFKMF